MPAIGYDDKEQLVDRALIDVKVNQPAHAVGIGISKRKLAFFLIL